MTLPDHIEAMLREMRLRIFAAPFFLKGMLAPVDTYLHGKCGWRVFSDRSTAAIAHWDLGTPDVREVLEKSWYPEMEFIMKICRALCDKDFDVPEDEEAFRAEILKALQEYIAQPEPKERIYLLP